MNEDLEFYIAASRLRSKRRRKRARHRDFEKHLIGLARETKALKKQAASLGYEPLNSPYQRGWKCVFVLREDVARSKDAPFFEHLLEKINTTQFHWRKDFKVRKRRHGRKIYVDRNQKLKEFSPYDFDKMKFTDKEKTFFELVYVLQCKQPLPVYIFTERWRYVLRVQPNMITKVRIIDHDLEARRKEIDSFLTRNHLYPRLFKIVNGRYKWRWKWLYEDEKYPSPLKNKSFAEVLHEHWPACPSTENPRIDPGVSFFCVFTTPSTCGCMQRQIRPPVKRKLFFLRIVHFQFVQVGNGFEKDLHVVLVE